jgi:hypothetical protein
MKDSISTYSPAHDDWDKSLGIFQTSPNLSSLMEVPMDIAKTKFDSLYKTLHIMKDQLSSTARFTFKVSEEDGCLIALTPDGKTCNEWLHELQVVYTQADWRYIFE